MLPLADYSDWGAEVDLEENRARYGVKRTEQGPWITALLALPPKRHPEARVCVWLFVSFVCALCANGRG